VDEREHVREVYTLSAARLVTQVYAMIGDLAEAQDAVQEAFARALTRPGRLRRLDNPEAWLRTVAVNVARSRRRRHAVFERLVHAGKIERTAPTVPGLSPDHVALVAALQRLPVATRETVVLHHLADLPVAEVAVILGCSVDAVKTRLVRGRQALAKNLGESKDLSERELRHA
jgi:RNA polymerase sigma-70 factor (ECF subfamily)